MAGGARFGMVRLVMAGHGSAGAACHVMSRLVKVMRGVAGVVR